MSESAAQGRESVLPTEPKYGSSSFWQPSQDRCDKCGTPKALWAEKPCVKSLTQSPRHTITRFHIPIPEAESRV